MGYKIWLFLKYHVSIDFLVDLRCQLYDTHKDEEESQKQGQGCKWKRPDKHAAFLLLLFKLDVTFVLIYKKLKI